MAKTTIQYKRRQMGRAYIRKVWELAISVGVALLTFVAAETLIDISSITDSPELIESAAKATNTATGSVQPVIELVGHILHKVNLSLQIMLSLIMALLAFTMSELISSLVNVKREVTYDNLFEADARVIDLVDTILDSTGRFQIFADSAPRLQALLSEYLDQKKEAFKGFLQRIAELDIDIDSGSETSFTTRLIEIAETKIHAISVDEEEFYSTDKEARAYLSQQMDWLAKSERREVIRIFVVPDTHRTSETEKFNEMMSIHPAILSDLAKSIKGPASKTAMNRYRYVKVKWKDWSRIIKEKCDLVIYDEKYIRKGILELDESRRAQFRANSADVVDAVMKFRELLAVSTTPDAPPSMPLTPLATVKADTGQKTRPKSSRAKSGGSG